MSKTEQEKKVANAEYQKKYRVDNIETLTEYEKNYKKEHAGEIKAYNTEYYEQHKNELEAKKGQKVICDCGGEYSLCHKARHMKTKKHIDKMAEKANKK